MDKLKIIGYKKPLTILEDDVEVLRDLIDKKCYYMIIKRTSLIITILTLVLVVITYVLDLNKSNWVCGPFLFLSGIIITIIQILIMVPIYIINNSIFKKILLGLIICFLILYSLGFYSFLTNCS